jgi:electron transport complex protein RnfB
VQEKGEEQEERRMGEHSDGERSMEMAEGAYRRLAEALDHLPNAFPRTPGGWEIAILQKIFTPGEAWLASQLIGQVETVAAIAQRVELSEEETEARLRQLAGRGLLWTGKIGGQPGFRLAPFIVGIYETQADQMDSELAHLFEHYMADGGAAGLMSLQPSLHRVVPAQTAVKSEWILPYDNVHKLLLEAQSFHLGDCVCRSQQEQAGLKRCQFPLRTCLSFSSELREMGPQAVSQEEALAALDRFETMGLVHTVSNVAEGVWYVCNCCGCCCGILRGITDFGIEQSVARANYRAVLEREACIACGICLDRCQVHAISQVDGVTLIDGERCIGCGLCVTACPQQAIALHLIAEAERIHPPYDFADWEQQRLRNRGIAE